MKLDNYGVRLECSKARASFFRSYNGSSFYFRSLQLDLISRIEIQHLRLNGLLIHLFSSQILFTSPLMRFQTFYKQNLLRKNGRFL
jgi:hypothetical protein